MRFRGCPLGAYRRVAALGEGDIAGGIDDVHSGADAILRPPAAFTPRFAHFRAVFDNVGDMRNGKGRNVKITGDGK
jgi:hypothetical protein